MISVLIWVIKMVTIVIGVIELATTVVGGVDVIFILVKWRTYLLILMVVSIIIEWSSSYISVWVSAFSIFLDVFSYSCFSYHSFSPATVFWIFLLPHCTVFSILLLQYLAILCCFEVCPLFH